MGPRGFALVRYQQKSKRVMSNTYNPTWKEHPNFSWQKRNNTLDPNNSNQQGYQTTLKSLENQVGQISQELKTKPMEGFPSDLKSLRVLLTSNAKPSPPGVEKL
ncbi:hypothetical protein GQ457_11G024320 [Hibiscus cannabinus]